MNNVDIEAWTLAVVDRARAKQPIEDSRVEIKRDWPEPPRAARLVAGHANAARGAPILWIIGIDEAAGTILTPPSIELADWLNQFRSRFDGVPPELEANLIVPVDQSAVVALLFRTDRAPYVVKVENAAAVHREVPWRSGNSTVTATREQLLRILAPTVALPSISFRESSITMHPQVNRISWSMAPRIFVTPPADKAVVLPFHDCWATLSSADNGEIGRCGLEFEKNASDGIVTVTKNEATFRGPGMCTVRGSFHVEAPTSSSRLTLTLHLRPVGSDEPVVIEAEHFRRSKNGADVQWSYVPPRPWEA